MTLKIFVDKVRRKFMKLRLQPIRVFCLHHVCKNYDTETMYACDWMEISVFQSKINNLRKQGYKFVTLSAAYKHLQNDWIRTKKYAVLTFDDGYKSLNEILPWLEEQKIPVTLFINGIYLDGKSYRKSPKEQYLTYDELFALTSPLIEIGHHGWEHTAATEMTDKELLVSLQKNIEILSAHPRYIPFWAYTYGIHNQNSDVTLSSNGMTLVLVDGGKNYKRKGSIARELF